MTSATADDAGGRVRWLDAAESVQTNAPVPPARWVLACAGLSPVLLTGAWLVAGAVQPASYSPARQTVSVLAGHAGTDRWIMTGALYLVGICNLGTAAGLTSVRMRARVGLVVAGLTAIGVASFPEPAHGNDTRHALCTVIGALAITVWPALVAQREAPVSRAVSGGVSAVASALSMALFAWAVFEIHHGDALGLAERAMSSLQLCWPFVVALSLRRAAGSLPARTEPTPVSGAWAGRYDAQ